MNASRSNDARINPQDWEQILRENAFSREQLEIAAAMMALELKNLLSFLPSGCDYLPLYDVQSLQRILQ